MNGILIAFLMNALDTLLMSKSKPLRSGVRKSNGSRANITLFSFKLKGSAYRNADHWENASAELSKSKMVRR